MLKSLAASERPPHESGGQEGQGQGTEDRPQGGQAPATPFIGKGAADGCDDQHHQREGGHSRYYIGLFLPNNTAPDEWARPQKQETDLLR